MTDCIRIMRERLHIWLRDLRGDLRGFNAAGQIFIMGAGCSVLLYLFSTLIACIVFGCTFFVYRMSRHMGGWKHTLLCFGFIVYLFFTTNITLFGSFAVNMDFPPNGAENYKYVPRDDFFPEEIPATAYDVQVYSVFGFGQGWDEAYLSYRDTPEHIAPYAEIARERAQQQSRSPFINEGIQVPKITVDETRADPRFLEDSLARFLLNYTPHPVKIEGLDEPFVFYVWDANDRWNHPKGKVVGVSEDGTHIIFYSVG